MCVGWKGKLNETHAPHLRPPCGKCMCASSASSTLFSHLLTHACITISLCSKDVVYDYSEIERKVRTNYTYVCVNSQY